MTEDIGEKDQRDSENIPLLVENPEEFWKYFKVRYEGIKSSLNVDSRAELLRQIQELEIRINEARGYLPSYDLKTYMEKLGELKELGRGLKKKSAKLRNVMNFAKDRDLESMDEKIDLQTASHRNVNFDKINVKRGIFEISSKARQFIKVENQDKRAIEFKISNIDGCLIDLRDCSENIAVLHITNVVNSVIFIEHDIPGVITIRDSCKCSVISGSVVQFRAENCSEINCLIYCKTRAIIENSDVMKFYEQQAVDDFSWLRANASSPHYSYLSAEVAKERVGKLVRKLESIDQAEIGEMIRAFSF